MKRYTQRGFSIVSAVFLLVVLAVMGTAMVTFSTAQYRGQTLDMMGSRAYQAANAGIEWAAYNIATNPGVAVASQTLAGLDGNLSDFTVTVSYTAVAHSDAVTAGEAEVNVWAYDITATAVYGTPGTAEYVERMVKAKI